MWETIRHKICRVFNRVSQLVTGRAQVRKTFSELSKLSHHGNWYIIFQRMNLSLINLKIPLYAFLILRSVKEEVCPKVNVIARLEYELAYYNPAVHRFNYYTMRTPPQKKIGLDHKQIGVYCDDNFVVTQCKTNFCNRIECIISKFLML